MKLSNFLIPVSMAKLLGVFLSIGAVVVANGEPAEEVKSPVPQKVQNPSWFKADKDGVLWFNKGDDGETKFSASLVLSAVKDTIVITVAANEEHIEGAVKLAKKMRDLLQKSKHTPDRIPIVVWKDKLPGIGYTFYTDGMAVDHDELGKKGVFKPSEAKRKEVLNETLKQYRILMEEYVPQGKWGKNDDKETALKIIGP